MSHGAARIAMWSGPRNISSAMMRAWENRRDTVVVDEPFYAFYLTRTRIDHPGAEEIVRRGETDWRRVVDSLLGPLPRGRSICFQKQMTLHLLPEIDRGWLDAVVNCFLIRDPKDVILSYVRKRPEPTLEDLGFIQQLELYRWLRAHTSQDPPVLDARDVQDHPREVLGALCARIGVAFDERMLTWPAGPRSSDGIWARWWYDAVERSTGWQPYRPKTEPLPERYEALWRSGMEAYEQLAAVRIRP